MITGEDASQLNPYPGLRPYTPAEHYLFFGRERTVDELLVRLGRRRFLAVLGASGSGKSSLVLAGLIPALQSGLLRRAGAHWRTAIIRPGGDPIGRLGRSLAESGIARAEGIDASERQVVAETVLRRSSRGLAEIVRQAREASDTKDDNVLVVVDQFEELFRFTDSVGTSDAWDDAAAFVKLLMEAAEAPNGAYILLTMRSDFLGDCARFRDLAAVVSDNQYLIPRMTRGERRRAILKPLTIAGAEGAPRLVSRLLNDVGDEPDQLPVMQHALMRTFDIWRAGDGDGKRLDVTHYQQIGELERALSMHADEALNELDDAQQEVARRVFQALTVLGPDNRGVRRPTRYSDLCEIVGGDAGDIAAVVDAFRRAGRGFLLPAAQEELLPGSVVDISHESLMRGWTRLREWVRDEARDADTYRRLSDTARHHARGEAGLWGDPDLGVALAWRERVQPNDAWAKRYDPKFDLAMRFIDESARQRQRELTELRMRDRRALVKTAFGVVAVAATALYAQSAIERARSEAALTVASFEERRDELLGDVDGDSRAEQLPVATLSQGARSRRLERAEKEENSGRVALDRGELSAAEGHFERSIDAWLSVRKRAAPEVLRLAAVAERLGDLRYLTGDLSGARTQHERAGRWRKKVPKRLALVAASYRRVADIDRELGRLGSARVWYQRSLGLLEPETAPRAESVPVAIASELSLVREGLGDLESDLGAYESARSLYDAALAFWRIELQGSPGATDPSRALARVAEKAGDLERMHGAHTTANALYLEALDLRRWMLGELPEDPAARLELAGCLERLGDLAWVVRTEQATQPDLLQRSADVWYREAFELRRTLADAFPNGVRWSRALSSSLVRLAEVATAAGDRPAALRWHLANVEHTRQLVQRWPGDRQAERDLSTALAGFAFARKGEGDSDAAVRTAERALKLASTLVDRTPENIRMRLDVADRHLALAELTRPIGAWRVRQHLGQARAALGAADCAGEDARLRASVALHARLDDLTSETDRGRFGADR